MEDGYEFFAQRQLVTIFSAPNYCGEFDNSGAMMYVDENLMCSFQVGTHSQQTQSQTGRTEAPRSSLRGQSGPCSCAIRC